MATNNEPQGIGDKIHPNAYQYPDDNGKDKSPYVAITVPISGRKPGTEHAYQLYQQYGRNQHGICQSQFFCGISCGHEHYGQKSHGGKEKSGQIKLQMVRFPYLVKNFAKFLVTLENNTPSFFSVAKGIPGKAPEGDL